MTNKTSLAVEMLPDVIRRQVETGLLIDVGGSDSVGTAKAIAAKYNRYETVLQWLLYESGHKDGRIPGDELDMIEKALSYDPLDV